MTFMCIFFFNDTATTEIYTLSLHDALPIYTFLSEGSLEITFWAMGRYTSPQTFKGLFISSSKVWVTAPSIELDRKSTRLNSSHANISYAVFCLKKKKKTPTIT